MAKIEMKNAAGKKAASIEVADSMFGITPNIPVMHQVVVAQLAHRRSGTQSTKTRSEVRGGGKKPFKQKGTGNARQGSIRAPHFSGGGVALGPKPRKYSQRTPKKMIQLALRSALSDCRCRRLGLRRTKHESCVGGDCCTRNVGSRNDRARA